MTIKKQFIPIIEFLETNKAKKVSTILEEVKEMASASTRKETTYKVDGKLVAIFCYYHKQWELVDEVEFGAKKSSATGLNNMCKVGTNAWYKQQREARKAKEALLAEALRGECDRETLLERQEDIEAKRLVIDETDKPEGFATLDELKAYLGT